MDSKYSFGKVLRKLLQNKSTAAASTALRVETEIVVNVVHQYRNGLPDD